MAGHEEQGCSWLGFTFHGVLVTEVNRPREGQRAREGGAYGAGSGRRRQAAGGAAGNPPGCFTTVGDTRNRIRTRLPLDATTSFSAPATDIACMGAQPTGPGRRGRIGSHAATVGGRQGRVGGAGAPGGMVRSSAHFLAQLALCSLFAQHIRAACGFYRAARNPAKRLGARPMDHPLEGRHWWLELQRQRAADKAAQRRRSHRPTAAPAAAATGPLRPACSHEPSGVSADGERAWRRSSLLQQSEALLRRMTRQQPDDGGDGAEAAAPEPALAADGPGRRILVSSLRRLSSQQSDGEQDGGGALSAEPSAAGSRRSSRGGGGGGGGGGRKPADVQVELSKLLEGGLVGRAMAASAQWRATQQQLAAREQQERRMMHGEGASSIDPAAMAAAAACELPQAGSSALLSQLLPPLAEGGEEEVEAAEGTGGGQACAAPPSQWRLERAAADDLIAAFPFADQREYLHQSLAALDSRAPDPAGPAAQASTAAAGHSLADSFSAAATSTSGGDAPAPAATARLSADPLLTAWMVTRAPPDLPVRGYAPPPGRSACRLVAAKEMRE